MFGIDRQAARFTWTAALLILLLWLLFQVRATVFVFILAVLFAYLLWPLVQLLDRFLPTRTRAAALALAYVVFVALVVTFGIQIGSRVAEQANRLARELPAHLEKWTAEKPPPADAIGRYKLALLEAVQSEIPKRASDLVAALPQAGAKFLSVASSLIYVVLIPIIAFFFLKDAALIRQHILDIVAEGPRRALLNEVLADLDTLLAHYMRALVVLSLTTFTAFAICLSIVGMPYSILLATLAAGLEIIPMLGPLAAGITIVIVAALSGAHVLVVVIFLLAYRMVLDYVISPHVMGHGVQLHPALVLFGVFAGAEIAGIAGAFLSVPVLALVRILYLRMRKARLGSRTIELPT